MCRSATHSGHGLVYEPHLADSKIRQHYSEIDELTNISHDKAG